MDLADYEFIPLTSDIDLSSFECDEKEITDFLQEDALDYQTQRMANTYLFADEDRRPVAYFCISNDCLVDKGFSNRTFNRLHRKTNIPNPKRIRQYPAIKVGRLGLTKSLEGKGIGSQLMDFIKAFITQQQNSACRFLLLDAINKPKQIHYYKKNGFEFLLDEDEADVNRIMYYDLMRLE